MTPPLDPHAVLIRPQGLIDLHGSATEMALKCGLSKNTVSEPMRGRALPNAMTPAHLCKGLDVSADWLLFGAVQP